MDDRDRQNQRFGELTPEILASISADDVADAIVQHVAQRVTAAGEGHRDEVIVGLPSGTQAVYTTWLVDAEVNNGGLNQFFFSKNARFAGLALAGYELFGAEEYASVMRAAIATY